MNDKESGLLLKVTCAVEVPRGRVFTMLTEPVELTKWWGPRGFTMPHVEVDLRVGGRYRFSMKPPEGDLFHVSGEYMQIERPTRLVYTFIYEEPTPDDQETVVTLSLKARGDATDIDLSQGPFLTEERVSLHRRGWTESFERLSRLTQPDG